MPRISISRRKVNPSQFAAKRNIDKWPLDFGDSGKTCFGRSRLEWVKEGEEDEASKCVDQVIHWRSLVVQERGELAEAVGAMGMGQFYFEVDEISACLKAGKDLI